MRQCIFLFFLCSIGRMTEATIIDVKSICQGKRSEMCQFCGTKKISSWLGDEFVNRSDCQGIILDKEGHILVPKTSLEKCDHFKASWSDEKGNLCNMDAIFIDQHSKVVGILLGTQTIHVEFAKFLPYLDFKDWLEEKLVSLRF